MIHKIIIENYWSIADRQEIDFRVSANVPQLSCFKDSISNANSRLPLVVGLFGPNAAGKSTILRAVVSVVNFMVTSFNFEPEASISWIYPYMNKVWWDKPSKITIEFEGALNAKSPIYLFRYELWVGNKRGKFAKDVVFESLSYAPKGKFRKLFERHNQEFDFGNDFEMANTDPAAKKIRSNASVLSTLNQFNHPVSRQLLSTFDSWQFNSQIPKWISSGTLAAYYLQRPNLLKQLNYELGRLDLGLEEIKIDIKQTSNPMVIFKHLGLDDSIMFNHESAGTRRFIENFPLFQEALDAGGMVLIDELDGVIHPHLFPEIFRWFYDAKRNPRGAQLLFTAHNPFLLDELKKEQVVFVEKPNGKSTIAYKASDVQGLRRDISLMKKYLSGELGAVPNIG